MPDAADTLAGAAPSAGAAASSVEHERHAALLKAGALQTAILKSTNFTSIATDERGLIQIFNVGAERMLGYDAAEVVNRATPADLADEQDLRMRAQALAGTLQPAQAPGFDTLVSRARLGIEDVYELTFVRKDGSRLPALVSVTALQDAAEAIIGYLLVGTDNTARRDLETERERAARALQDSLRELGSAKLAAEAANLAKSEFLSSMSHELRSPLNAILGFAQLLETGAPAPTAAQKDSIEQILHAGWYLLALINEILDLALIESGRLSLSPEPMALADVLADCGAMFEPQAAKRGIHIDLPSLEQPWLVHADRTRVKQVLVNLLSNAIKYNRDGGLVELRCARHGSRTRVSVRDTGDGLPPDRLGQLFQPFNRLGQENGAQEGTGIGLVVSKRLVELMGGAIGAESVPGVGSLFWFELDALAAAAPGLESAQHPAGRDLQVVSTAAGGATRSLLYVEDNPANLRLIARLLERRPDIRLMTAGDGRSGVELARSGRPDVVLMDINLPGISGISALHLLAGDPATAHIPVLALSANAMPRDIEKGLRAGFFRYLTKPIRVNEFMQALDLAFEHASAGKPAQPRRVTT